MVSHAPLHMVDGWHEKGELTNAVDVHTLCRLCLPVQRGSESMPDGAWSVVTYLLAAAALRCVCF